MEGDNSKRRGQEHHAVKKKYNKHKAAHIAVPKKKNVLDSNWDRYEQEEDEGKLTSATDFALLASAPISCGSHFQFKTDKDDFLENLESFENPSIFNLDLVKLEEGLNKLPSHLFKSGQENEDESMLCYLKKMGIDEQLFKSNDDTTEIDLFFGSNCESDDNPSDNDETVPKSDDVKPEQKISPDFNKAEAQSESAKNSKEDLEQWLDDILDE